MLFALLFDDKDQLVAAAPAVFVYAVGDLYWGEHYARPLATGEGFQTAYLEINEPGLIEKLNSLESSDEHLAECCRRIESTSLGIISVISHRKAA